MSIHQVSRDVLSNIASQLDGVSLYNFSATCRGFNDFIGNLALPQMSASKTLKRFVDDNNVDGVQWAIRAGAVVDKSCLARAANGSVELMKTLLATGVETTDLSLIRYDVIGNIDADLLEEAVAVDNLALVGYLLELFPVSPQSLAIAVTNGSVEMLKLLLESPNRQVDRSDAAYVLHLCEYEPQETVELMLADERFRLTDDDIRHYFDIDNEDTPEWLVAKY